MSDRRCHATNRAGDPCAANPLRDGQFCSAHDPHLPAGARFGSSEQAAQAATGVRRRPPSVIELLRERVEAEAEAILAPYFEALAQGEGVEQRMRAAERLLDRVFGRPKQSAELSMVAGLAPLHLGDGPGHASLRRLHLRKRAARCRGPRYRAIQPEQNLEEVNPPNAANARLSGNLPWDRIDFVPQRLADRIIWQSVFGPNSAPPPAGPNASPIERDRATGALSLLRQGKSARRWLLRGEEEEEGAPDLRSLPLANLFAVGNGLSVEAAEERLEALEEAAEGEVEAEK